MKAVCVIQETPASAAAVLRYCYRQRKGDNESSKAEVVGWEGHAFGGVIVGDAMIDAEAFTSRCSAGKRAVGHAVISAEADEPGVEKKLLKAGHSWATRFAPGRGHVVIVHKKDKDCAHPHIHIIYERYGPEGTVSHFSKADIKAMNGMKFTTEFQAARSDDSPSPHRGAGRVYPKAKNLKVTKVAGLILQGETWASLREQELIAPAPARKGRAGHSTTTFIYESTKIRYSTVEKFVEHERKRQATAQALATKAKANALAKNAKGMMSRGLGDLIDVVDEIATAEPVSQVTHGRGSR